MTRFLFFLFAFSIFNISKAQPPLLLWANSCGGAAGDQGRGIVADASGNVYVCGQFNGTADFDPSPSVFTVTSNGASDIFISKYNAQGSMMWTKCIGGSGNDAGYSIGVDGSGNVVTTGVFSGTVDFDPGAGVNNLSGDSVFVCKLDGLGNFQWAKSFGASRCKSLVVDGNDEIYVGGYFVSTVDFDPGPSTATLISAGLEDAFVSRFDVSGNLVWTKKLGGSGSDRGYAVSTDVAGNVYLAGSFESTVQVDPGLPIITSAGAKDIFITKLNSSGAFQWAKQIGGSAGNDEALAMAVDATGDVFTTGSFFGTVDFDPGASTFTLSSTGGNADADVFVSKLTTAGTFTWARSFGGNGMESGNALSIDVSGNSYIGGYFNQSVDFDPGAATVTIVSNGGEDIFINKLNSSGNYVWAVTMGGSGNEREQSIAVDVNSSVLSAGFFNGTVDFDPTVSTTTLNSAGADDIFIQKLIQCITPPAPTNQTQASYTNVCSGTSATLSVFSSGTVSWYASPTSTTVLGTGLTFFSPTLALGGYTYYAAATTCTNSATRTAVTVTVISCAGIREINANRKEIQLYPNPNNGSFEIVLDEAAEVMVMNVNGQIVYSEKMDQGKKNIYLSEIPPGIYFIEAKSEGFTARQKFVIIR